MSASFQTAVNFQPGNAVAGDFASNNPRATVLAGPGGLVAGSSGITIAAFAWVTADSDGNYTLAANTGSGAPTGFVNRADNIGVITTFGDGYGFNVPAGYQITLYNAGDFWVETGTAATVGQKVFASTTDGTVHTAAAGATVTGYVETPFYVASPGAANSLIKMSALAV